MGSQPQVFNPPDWSLFLGGCGAGRPSAERWGVHVIGNRANIPRLVRLWNRLGLWRPARIVDRSCPQKKILLCFSEKDVIMSVKNNSTDTFRSRGSTSGSADARKEETVKPKTSLNYSSTKSPARRELVRVVGL
jgi:hypothetical protein